MKNLSTGKMQVRGQIVDKVLAHPSHYPDKSQLVTDTVCVSWLKGVHRHTHTEFLVKYSLFFSYLIRRLQNSMRFVHTVYSAQG